MTFWAGTSNIRPRVGVVTRQIRRHMSIQLQPTGPQRSRLVTPVEPALPRAHVVGAQQDSMIAALREAVSRNVRLTAWERVPAPSAVAAADLVIVDLTVDRNPVQPRSITALLDLVEVWLVVGVTAVDPGWVDRARHPRVRVIQIGTGGESHVYDALITALLERYRGLTWSVDPGRLLAFEPGLVPLGRYITVLCAHPWLVRRPRDLADLSHISLHTLKLECLELGFNRVEHFIIYVRALAYEQLVARGLSARDARRISGFSDPSNMRRHVRRALHRSPDVLKQDQPA